MLKSRVANPKLPMLNIYKNKIKMFFMPGKVPILSSDLTVLGVSLFILETRFLALLYIVDLGAMVGLTSYHQDVCLSCGPCDPSSCGSWYRTLLLWFFVSRWYLFSWFNSTLR